MKAKLQNLLERVGEQYIRDVDADLQDLRRAGPSYDSFMRLTDTEVPMLERDLETHRSAKESLMELHEKVSKLFLLHNYADTWAAWSNCSRVYRQKG